MLGGLTERERSLARSESSGQLPAVWATWAHTDIMQTLQDKIQVIPELTDSEIYILTCSKSAEVNLFQCMCESSMGQDTLPTRVIATRVIKFKHL